MCHGSSIQGVSNTCLVGPDNPAGRIDVPEQSPLTRVPAPPTAGSGIDIWRGAGHVISHSVNNLPTPGHEGGGEGVSAHAPAGVKMAPTAVSKAATTTANKTAEGPQPRQPKADSPTSVDSVGVQLAVDIGWTMAVLYGQLRPESGGRNDRLPTEHELPPAQRIKLETERVNSLLVRLGALLPANPRTQPGVPSVIPLTGAPAPAAAAGTATPGKPATTADTPT